MIVGVIGSGSIGPDLAYGFLTAVAREPGAKVYLVDIKQEGLDAGVARIRGSVLKDIALTKRGLVIFVGARSPPRPPTPSAASSTTRSSPRGARCRSRSCCRATPRWARG